jgi:O-acetylhomoserine/O-acetylserine sulfhydrylase-like pyridoxal-dependent enzyme
MIRSSRIVSLVALAATVVVLIAGCGGSKPAFCSNVSDLQSSVKGLNVSGGLSSIKTQLQTIEKQGKSVISSAKSDFPSDTAAMKTAFTNLQTEVKSISSKPDVSQLATLATDAKAAVDSVNNFVSASKSKC